jgi:predicted aldo/keto reductase-like oxidoreductase
VYEEILSQNRCRVIAMQVLAGGAVPAKEAIEYVSSIPGISSILFGASSKNNIEETASLIRHYDNIYAHKKPTVPL